MLQAELTFNLIKPISNLYSSGFVIVIYTCIYYFPCPIALYESIHGSVAVHIADVQGSDRFCLSADCDFSILLYIQDIFLYLLANCAIQFPLPRLCSTFMFYMECYPFCVTHSPVFPLCFLFLRIVPLVTMGSNFSIFSSYTFSFMYGSCFAFFFQHAAVHIMSRCHWLSF